jgi:hypothetical protein
MVVSFREQIKREFGEWDLNPLNKAVYTEPGSLISISLRS